MFRPVLPAEAAGCVRCAQLAETRKQVVLGAGDPDADLMFVGEAPGRGEDEQGLPLTGRAGALLDELLQSIGLARSRVFVTNCLLCRPPGNRDPLPQEAANCQPWLHAQLEQVRPKLVCPLGNHATRLVRSAPGGITQLHGQPEVRVVGTRAVRLLPLFHPAAALYTRPLLETLRADFARIPELLALEPPEQPRPPEVPPPPDPPPESDAQLGLF
jgi:uracil-DNA glycosylase